MPKSTTENKPTRKFIPDSDEFIDFSDNEVIRRLRKDLRANASTMRKPEAQLLVKYYYQFQLDRIRTNNRIVAFEKNNSEPVACLGFFYSQLHMLENLMKAPLEEFVYSSPVGSWLMERKGIGPVLGAGLLAYLVVQKTVVSKETNEVIEFTYPKVSSWWRFGGYDPTLKWKKGQKRPYCAELKTLYYKVGKSIIMTGANDIYRPLYDKRKQYAHFKNESGGYIESAQKILQNLKVTQKETHQLLEHDVNDEISHEEQEEEHKKMVFYLQQGKLPPFIIDAQSRRWMVQLFTSHLHTVMWETEMKTPAAMPYALAHLDPKQHFEYIPVPGYIPLANRSKVKDCPPHGIYTSK